MQLDALTQDGRHVRFDVSSPGTIALENEVPRLEAEALAWVGDHCLLAARQAYAPIPGVNWQGDIWTWIDPSGGQGQECGGRLDDLPRTTLTAMASRPGERRVRVLAEDDRWAEIELVASPVVGQVAEVTGGTVEPASLELVGNGYGGDGVEYAIDAAGDQLVRSSGGGAYTPVGPLGTDVSDPAAFDADGDLGYLAAGGSLYTVALATGTAVLVGPIAGDLEIRDLDVVPPPIVVGRDYNRVFEGGNRYYGRQEIPILRFGDTVPPVDFSYTFERVASTGPVAEPGEDFAPGGGSGTMPAGVSYLRVDSPVLEDDLVEPYEWLGYRVNGRLDRMHVVDNDTEFPEPTVEAAEDAGVVVVGLRTGAEGSGLYEARIVDAAPGTSRARLLTPVVAVGPGEAPTVRVGLTDDSVARPDEEVRVELIAPGVARLANPRRFLTLRIADDDRPLGADRTRPSVRLLKRRLRLARTVRIPFRCSEACRAGVQLRTTRRAARRLGVPVRIARATRRLRRAGRGTAILRIDRRVVRRLKAARRLPLSVRLTAVDAAGNRGRAVRRMSVRR